MAAKIKKGDKVVILAGKDKGKTGNVTQVFPTETRATVQGLNLVRRHTRQTASQDAGIYTKESSIHLSNLALVDAKAKHTVRNEEQLTKCGWSPWHGVTLTGRAVQTIVNGEVVYADGKVNDGVRGQELLYENGI